MKKLKRILLFLFIFLTVSCVLKAQPADTLKLIEIKSISKKMSQFSFLARGTNDTMYYFDRNNTAKYRIGAEYMLFLESRKRKLIRGHLSTPAQIAKL
ncbi:MAG: hypothetical protein V4665_01255 [Patescibacteria group bacterium]